MIYNSNRRAKIVGSQGCLSLREWVELKTKYGNMCLRCKRPEGEVKLVPDHVVPLIAGGPHSIENIQPLCERCNLVKGSKTADFRNGSVVDLSKIERVRHQNPVTHCPNGHEYTEENTYVRRNNWKECRTCKRESMRKHRKGCKHCNGTHRCANK